MAPPPFLPLPTAQGAVGRGRKEIPGDQNQKSNLEGALWTNSPTPLIQGFGSGRGHLWRPRPPPNLQFTPESLSIETRQQALRSFWLWSCPRNPQHGLKSLYRGVSSRHFISWRKSPILCYDERAEGNDEIHGYNARAENVKRRNAD